MKKLSRAKNTMRNTLWGAIYRVATLIGPFAIKTIIIKELGQEYNGLSTLFTSVLTVLNLANLGFNSSLVFTMYKAIAEDDKPALCAMLKFYRKVYRIVGLVILGMGLAVMPFLPWLVKNECPPDVNLYVLFAIYLSESVLDYLMFAYNNATFTAFQRNDVTLKDLHRALCGAVYPAGGGAADLLQLLCLYHPAAADGDPQQRGGVSGGPEALPGHRVSG